MLFGFTVKKIEDDSVVEESGALTRQAMLDYCTTQNYDIGVTNYIVVEPIDGYKARIVAKASEHCHDKMELIAPIKKLLLAALDIGLDSDTKRLLKNTARDFALCCDNKISAINAIVEDAENFTHIDQLQAELALDIWPTALVDV